MKYLLMFLTALLFLNSCASKKEVLYLQDIDTKGVGAIPYQTPNIQPNDILKITIESSMSPETAIPYNRSVGQSVQSRSIELMQLEGYVVSLNNTVNIPVLGEISSENKTTEELAQHITELLVSGGHLADARVDVRLLNAKITILGEVRSPGTFNYTDQ